MSGSTDEIWDVFISHASEDKSVFVEPLARAIEESGYSVWYDRFTLKWGDSLRQSIERGLERSRYGIVVLSKAFFRKRWPQAELDGLFAKESGGEKVILPIWHGVSEDEVRRRCPIVAGRLAMSSEDRIDSIVLALREVIGPPASPPRKEQIEDISSSEPLPELENLARNLWWLAHNSPNRPELTTKLEEVLNELRADIQQSQIVVPRKTERVAVPPRKGPSRYDDFVAIGTSGTQKDVDFLMKHMALTKDLATVKLADFALGLVNTRQGVNRIQHYLFKGSQMQRNYAALYFKRKGDTAILREAIREGSIDRLQAFAK
jgi:hypothetical protein